MRSLTKDDVGASAGSTSARHSALFGKFWLRKPLDCIGAFSVERMKSLADLPAEECFIAALLRQDRQSALSALSGASKADFAGRLIATGVTEKIAPLVYDRILDLELNEPVGDYSLNGAESLLDQLKADSRLAYQRHLAYERLFTQLIDLLGELGNQAVWIKGPVVARTLYAHPYLRSSTDFDVLVMPDAVGSVLGRLEDDGFFPLWNHPGECSQFGIGPVGSLEALSISPSKEFQRFLNVSLLKDGWPLVELKCDPWDKGLRTQDLKGLFERCETIEWTGRKLLTPSVVDHLLLELTHFHKHSFAGWHWLYDIHILITKLSENPESWQELVGLCKQEEELSVSAWAGLEMAFDRLSSPVPPAVLDELAPRNCGILVSSFTLTTNTCYLWNATSLPMLLLNALFLGDRRRKLGVLKECICPDEKFLRNYYCGGRTLSWVASLLCRLLHLLVLLFPGGLTRRIFGPHVWRPH